MKTQRLLISWTLVLGGVALLGACDVEQPAPQCTVGRGDHAVRYTKKAGTCGDKKAELVGAQAFRVPGSGVPPTLYFNAASLVLLPVPPSTTPVPTSAVGQFTTEFPSADNVCTVPSLSEASQTVDGVARGYRWSNVRVQGRASIPGTQWIADLEYSEDGCTATYEAVGVFPAIKCENAQKVRDESLCRVLRAGASLDPAFPIYCEETSNLCVLRGSPPAFEPTTP
ncbi:MAG: hypothetical protein ABW123_22320 [Cystobacter sp.]